jgi:Cu2+-exporting ATPase
MLLGGGTLGMGVLQRNRRKRRTQKLLALSSRGIDRDGARTGSVTRLDPGPNGTRPKTPQEREALNYLRGNTAALLLFAVSFAYPVLRLPAIVLSIYSCAPIYRRAFNAVVRERRLKNDVLNGLVVTGTLVTQHFFVTALYTFISNLGTVVVQRSQGYSEEMLKGVFNRKVTTVWALREGVELETPIEAVQIDDLIVIHTGELIPLDGVIVKGAVTVDQHMLTGESIPAEKAVDDEVFASTVVIAGYAWVKVTKTGQNTVVAKIENVLEGTSHFKTSIQLKGESWADAAAAPILGLGVFLWPIQGAGVATAVFNCSPGNGIRLSASAQTLTHIILASQRNILIKDGRVLEQLMEIDTVVFDKTGTLTEDRHEVTRILRAGDGFDEKEILYYAAATEQKVSHPLARAIIERADLEELVLPDVSQADSRYQVGMGVAATVEDKTVMVGSIRFIQRLEIEIPDAFQEEIEQSVAQGLSVVLIVIDGALAGAIEIRARLRPEILDVIQNLRERGIRHLYILSGDQLEPTRQLAAFLGLDGYFHNVSPEDKSSVIERLQQEGKKVCFIGDGINDVIAMKKANVSVSMSGASNIATDVAQVVFMSGSLAEMEHLLDVAKNLKRKLLMTVTSYTTVVVVSFTSIVFLAAPPFLALMVQSVVNNTYGMSQALLPLKQLRDNRKRELEREKRELLTR